MYIRALLIAILLVGLFLPVSATQAAVCIVTVQQTGGAINKQCNQITADDSTSADQLEALCAEFVDSVEGATGAAVQSDSDCATWQTNQDKQDAVGAVTLTNPLNPDPETGLQRDIPKIVGDIIRAFMGILGAITIFVFVDGAWNWITSAGYPQRVQQGIRTMLFAVAGLFVIFAAYGILDAFINAISTG